MIPLYSKPPSTVEFDGKIYPLDLAFGKVLQYFDMLEDGDLSQADITEVALGWFLPNTRVSRIEQSVQMQLLAKIRQEYITMPHRSLRGKKNAKTVDFRYDSGYIYAAFMQTYGIDLYECADTLQWCKFMSLFTALPEETAISQIMSIRGRELPAPTKTNREEIQHLTELKLIYALPQADGGKADAQKTLNGLFDMLYEKAKKR